MDMLQPKRKGKRSGRRAKGKDRHEETSKAVDADEGEWEDVDDDDDAELGFGSFIYRHH